MSLHTKRWVQKIPATIDDVWAFFSVPANLNRITPPDMRFRITSGNGDREIHEGMVLTYTLVPLLMLPVAWRGEITKVSRPDGFEDRQVAGPYEAWLHRHLFRVIEGGVEMTDIVSYSLPLGPFGDLADALFVGNRLDEVFEYRRREIERIFGRMA